MTNINEVIEVAIKLMTYDWENKKDIDFIKAMCNNLAHEIEKSKSEEANN